MLRNPTPIAATATKPYPYPLYFYKILSLSPLLLRNPTPIPSYKFLPLSPLLLRNPNPIPFTAINFYPYPRYCHNTQYMTLTLPLSPLLLQNSYHYPRFCYKALIRTPLLFLLLVSFRFTWSRPTRCPSYNLNPSPSSELLLIVVLLLIALFSLLIVLLVLISKSRVEVQQPLFFPCKVLGLIKYSIPAPKELILRKLKVQPNQQARDPRIQNDH